MDIKNALNSVLPPSLRPKERVERSIKSESTTDRDGNGQMPFDQGGQNEKRGPMSDEQIKKALEHLRGLQAVKDHLLTIELVTKEDGKRFVLIKEPDGKVVRRIYEHELWSLQAVQDTDKGQLLRKTA